MILAKVVSNFDKMEQDHESSVDSIGFEDQKIIENRKKDEENQENLKKTYKIKMFQIMLEKLDDEMTKRMGRKMTILNYKSKGQK